jgi:hypothetical protein
MLASASLALFSLVAAVNCASFPRDPSAVPLFLYLLKTSDDVDHFYTINRADVKSDGSVEGKLGYNLVKTAGFIYPTKQPGTVPLLRYFSQRDTDHLYTTDQNMLGSGNDAYKLQGTVGFVYPIRLKGSTPLFTSFNYAKNDHFYTTDQNELNAMEDYVSEGIGAFIFSA